MNGKLLVGDTTQAVGPDDVASLRTAGGLAVAKKAFIGDDLTVTGAVTTSQLSVSGDATIGGSTTLTGALAVTGDVNINGALTVDSTDASRITVAADADGEDLLLEVTGATDSSIVMRSSGTGTDAVLIEATTGNVRFAAPSGSIQFAST